MAEYQAPNTDGYRPGPDNDGSAPAGNLWTDEVAALRARVATLANKVTEQRFEIEHTERRIIEWLDSLVGPMFGDAIARAIEREEHRAG